MATHGGDDSRTDAGETPGNETGGATPDTSGTSGGPSEGGSGETRGTTTDAPAPLPQVVVLRANGGPAPQGAYWRFELFTAELEARGRTVTDTADWPASFDEVGLALLVINATPFSADQIADLQQVLAQGGMVIVHNEWSAYEQTENLNALLGGLNSELSFESSVLAGAGGGTVTLDEVAAHPFMVGIESIVAAAGSAVHGCRDGRELVSVEGQCYLAAEAHGAGWLFAFGDADIFDDHALMASAPEQNYALLAALEAAVP